MRTVISLLTLLLLTLPAARVQGQEKPWNLVGQVVSIEEGEDKPIKLAKVRLTIREFLRYGLSDDQGLFIVRTARGRKARIGGEFFS